MLWDEDGGEEKKIEEKVPGKGLRGAAKQVAGDSCLAGGGGSEKEPRKEDGVNAKEDVQRCLMVGEGEGREFTDKVPGKGLRGAPEKVAGDSCQAREGTNEARDKGRGRMESGRMTKDGVNLRGNKPLKRGDDGGRKKKMETLKEFWEIKDIGGGPKRNRDNGDTRGKEPSTFLNIGTTNKTPHSGTFNPKQENQTKNIDNETKKVQEMIQMLEGRSKELKRNEVYRFGENDQLVESSPLKRRRVNPPSPSDRSPGQPPCPRPRPP